MAYVPRLTAPDLNDPLYYSNYNKYYENGMGMPNCTAYAYGRCAELMGCYPTRPPVAGDRDAELWWAYTQDGLSRGQTPQLGAIACYANGDFSGLGHVCVLERDNGDNTWLVSESALNGYTFRASHSIAANGDYGYGNYTFQGFIYVPWQSGPGGGNFKWWMARKLIYQRKGLIV